MSVDDFVRTPAPLSEFRADPRYIEIERDTRFRELALDQLKREKAREWVPPLEGTDAGLLSELLASPAPAEPAFIEGLFGDGHNVTLTAPFKTGKTTAGLNVARSAVDGEPFLGETVHFPDSERVAWLNGEMTRADFESYASRVGIRRTDRVAVLHLRGRGLNITAEHVVDYLVTWLTEKKATMLVIDSWAKICRWAGVKENDNDGVGALTERIDLIKERAGVRNCLILSHTGRKRHEEGEEHVRGATALDDWVDARWIMTRVNGTRFLYAMGRGIQWGGDTGTALVFDEVTCCLSLGDGSTRGEVRSREGVEAVVQVVRANPGLAAGQLQARVGEALKITNHNDQVAIIGQAESQRLVHWVLDGRAHRYYEGPNPATAGRNAWIDGLKG